MVEAALLLPVSGPPLENAVVVVEGDRIRAVGRAGSTTSHPVTITSAVTRTGIISRRIREAPFRYSDYRSSPATVAVSHDARAPPNIALRPSFANADRRLGATAAMPPSWMPIDEKFAKPHRA